MLLRTPASKIMVLFMPVLVPLLRAEGEIDLVAHDGGFACGEHCHTLTMTDIATGWPVNRSVPNKARVWVIEEIDVAAAMFPFPILGIDSDNGSELINHHLLHYCEVNQITFTRGRLGKKNNGCHVEQLNQIWQADDGFANYFLPSFKHRDGTKAVKKYHQAVTPHQRALTHPATHKRTVIPMNARFKKRCLGVLQHQNLGLTDQLKTLSQTKGRSHLHRLKQSKQLRQRPLPDKPTRGNDPPTRRP